jgi:RNA polymerase sigma-70 factor (ECF subfamily)
MLREFTSQGRRFSLDDDRCLMADGGWPTQKAVHRKLQETSLYYQIMMLALQDESRVTDSYKYKQVPITVEEFFRQCFHEYFDKLYSYAFTMVKNNAEAKDIVQTAYIKLWEKRNEVNLAVSARAYLYTTVYHLSLNTIRNRKIREGHHKQMMHAVSAGHTNSAEEKETGTRITNLVNDLPPRCKEVFCKNRYEGKKYKEIADELGISIKTVEVQMGKALKFLRENLSDLLIITWLISLIITS